MCMKVNNINVISREEKAILLFTVILSFMKNVENTLRGNVQQNMLCIILTKYDD